VAEALVAAAHRWGAVGVWPRRWGSSAAWISGMGGGAAGVGLEVEKPRGGYM